jgi:alkylation response protein AidB-like acyl-CoA dehydrogenase/catechol 2,3-dioxygenase-like lactoylglutathione lyase family enzyme
VEILGLHHVAIVAPELSAARAFYADLLGLTERRDRPTEGRPGHWFDLGHQQLHIIRPGGLPSHFAIEVSNIDAAVAELRAKGLDVPEPHGISRSDRRRGETLQTLFVDPFGNRVEMTETAGRRQATSAPDWVRAEAADLAAWADAAEKDGRLPPALLSALHAGGMFRLLLPVWLEGAQLDPVSFVDAMEVLASVDASTAWCVCQAVGCSVAAAYLDRESALELFGERESVLAWGPDTGSHAVVLDDGYRVSGRWSYVSGIHHASWLGGSCRLFRPDGTPVLTDAGVQQTITVLFPAHHGSIDESWNVMGLRATGTDSFSVRDLFVPSRLAFAREDVSTRVDPAPLYGLNHASLFAAGFAAVVLGIAGGLLANFVELAQKKTPLGRERALRHSPFVQVTAARCQARLLAARALLHSQLATAFDESIQHGAPGEQSTLGIRLAASHAFTEAAAVADTAYHSAGVDAVFAGNGFERRLRDIRTATQQFQGRDEHYETVGRAMLAPNN